MSVLNEADAFTGGVLGVRVSKATAALPQTTTGNLFTITGGRVMVKQICGEVTTIIQNQANNTKISHDPDVGAAADLCAVLDIANDAVGTNYGITGTVANAMVGTSHAYLVGQAAPLILPAGVITLTCAASNTGSVKWDLFYVPIDEGARVVAV
jgi:hypothetical protein